MIYSKENIVDTFLIQEVQVLSENRFIPKARKFISNKKLKPLNTNIKWWIRILYLFLGFMSLGFAYSFFDLFLIDSMDKSFPILLFVQGLITYAVLEFLVNQKLYFNHGISDAFLLASFGQVIFYVAYFFDYENTLAVLFISSVLSAVLTYRFINVFMATVLFCSVFCFHFLVMLELGEVGKMLLPFSSISFALLILYTLKQIKKTKDYFFYYESCIKVIEVLSYMVFYLSGNYLVVRVASEELMNTSIADGEDISLWWFFNFFTIATPLAFIFFGIKNKNKLLLYVGLTAFVFAVYTIRAYHHVLPTEIALLIGGTVMFILSFLAIKKLKGKTEGLTFEPDSFENDLGFNELETFATASDFGVELSNDEFKFGDGKFGGGGAGSGY